MVAAHFTSSHWLQDALLGREDALSLVDPQVNLFELQTSVQQEIETQFEVSKVPALAMQSLCSSICSTQWSRSRAEAIILLCIAGYVLNDNFL